MKKGWKIALISLGSLLGLVIITIVVACWLIFTPARLTSIVNRLAGDFLTCENHFESVDLTLFKTYPNVGLEVKDVVLVNPYQLPTDNMLATKSSHNDTLAKVGSVTLGIDLRAFLKERAIVVKQLRVDDALANLYTAPDGWSNLSIFKSSDKEESEDTTKSAPYTFQLDKIAFNNLSLQYCNLQQNMLAKVNDLNLKLKGNLQSEAMDLDLSLDMAKAIVNMADSTGNETIFADLDNSSLVFDGDGNMNSLDGKLKMTIPSGKFIMGGQEYTTEAMRDSRKDLLTIKIPFHANIKEKSFTLDRKSLICLLNYELSVWGDVALAQDEKPMSMDLHYTIDKWQVADLLAILPPFITKSIKGMDVDAQVDIAGTAKGEMSEGRMPKIGAEVTISKGSFSSPKMLPFPIKNIKAKLLADINLSSDSAFKEMSKVTIEDFSAKMKHSQISISGDIDDLMGDMMIDAQVKGNLNLPDLQAFLPDTMPISMRGKAKANIQLKSHLSQLTDLNLKKIQAKGTMDFSKLDVVYDSIHASSPQLRLALALPIKKTSNKVSELIGAHITGGTLDVEMDNNGLKASVEKPDIRVGLPNILDKGQALAASFDIKLGKVVADKDSLSLNTDAITLKGSVLNDSTQENVLKQWNPDVDINLHRAIVSLQRESEPLRIMGFQFNYKPEICDITQADLLWGVSDYHLSGKVYGLEDWLSHKTMLYGDVNFSSQYADIDQLLNIISGMGTSEDTIAKQREEDNVPKEANPFIVPKDVNVRLNTHIGRCIALGNDLNDLAGSITVNDGVAVLDQVGFTCRAARMELTGVYKSPRVNHLFVGLDFHLLDIQIDELLAMIPSIDTLVPMLKSFDGKANFHLAAECNLNAFYQPKMSTLIGAAAINGKDLVVLENETLANIGKLLQFKNWREKDNNIGIDSISVEAQVFRKEITVYPFLLSLHKYQLCIGGRHTLDNNCNYHLELIKCPLPVRLAVDVNGKLQKPHIQLGKVQYAEMYIPEKRDELQSRTMELKKLVRQALEANVRKQ